MPVAWPGSGFPTLPTVSGASETPPDTGLRTPMDAGPAKVRRRFTSGPRVYSMRFVTTAALVGTFETFYTTDCSGGTAEFTCLHPRTGASSTCRFLSVPMYTPLGGTAWEIAFQMEILS